MIFRIYLKELYKNKIHFLINIVFLSLIFSVSLVLLSISYELPSKYSKMISANSIITIQEDINVELCNNDNYFYLVDNQIVNCYLFDGVDVIPTQIILIHNEEFDNKTIYVSNSLYNDNFDFEHASLKLSNSELGVEKTIDFKIEFDDYDFKAIYISDENLNEFDDTPKLFCININNFSDIEKAYSFIKNSNLDVSNYDNGLFSLYKSIILIKMTLFVLSISLIVYIVVMSYNMMKIYLNNKTCFLGLLKGFGMNQTQIFVLYFLILMTMVLISSLIGICISLVTIKIINRSSSIIFENSLNFKFNYCVPIMLIGIYILSFLLFFYKTISKKLKDNDLISLLKGDE